MRRALLTGVSQLSAKISEYNAKQLDTDIVEVTAHAGARPEHAAWQGGWYSISGKDETYNGVTYKDIVKATGYGTGAGLMGWNCRHSFFPVIPGIDEPKYTKEQLENIDPPPKEIDGEIYTYYEAEQQQRYMERIMRKTKRELVVLQAAGDEEQFIWRSILLRGETEEYVDFCEKAGLIPRPDRYGAVGYGRVISSKAKWSVRKAELKNGAEAAVNVNAADNSDIVTGNEHNSEQMKKISGRGKNNNGIINKNQIELFELLDKMEKNDIIELDKYFNQIKGAHSIMDDLRDKDMPICNPKYKEKRTDKSYKYNCGYCVTAYELRRRGYDVTAKPALGITVEQLSRFYNDFDLKKLEVSSQEQIIPKLNENILSWGENARGIICIAWKNDLNTVNNAGGHFFSFEVKNGKVMYIDPQNGKSDVSNYFNRADMNVILYARTDNLKVNKSIRNACKNRS